MRNARTRSSPSYRRTPRRRSPPTNIRATSSSWRACQKRPRASSGGVSYAVVIEFAGYTFEEQNASIVCQHVLDGHPVLLFVHEADGDVQFMCGAAAHETDDARLVGIVELLEHLRSIANMPV